MEETQEERPSGLLHLRLDTEGQACSMCGDSLSTWEPSVVWEQGEYNPRLVLHTSCARELAKNIVSLLDRYENYDPPEFPTYVGWDNREHGEY